MVGSGIPFFLAPLLLVLSLAAITSADYGDAPKPVLTYQNSEIKEKPLPIGIQGIVLCKSGNKYEPIQGAVTRVTCLGVEKNGYEIAPFSVLSYPTDENGYFFATLFPYQISNDLKITECKAFLEDSPLENCKVPTDVNKGISGALLSSYRLLHHKNMILYTVGPFFYTPEENNNGY
ncbi:hypothetical protein JCGZ_13969 [Jatropha curcas]|uniref:Pollen Ole e 1 allergen and extensin family protein n=1 Tax=Jatropha curcas TaxID=180498 RepID=A0A067JZL1_JATCU|nr:proline-rich protein 1 [Jatropha curcas]KDP28198.1 hypothetical protein JCGZ_13969 [Jatropha curcas]